MQLYTGHIVNVFYCLHAGHTDFLNCILAGQELFLTLNCEEKNVRKRKKGGKRQYCHSTNLCVCVPMTNHARQLVFLHCHLTGHAVFIPVGPAGSKDILKKKTNLHQPSILIHIERSLMNSVTCETLLFQRIMD